MLYSESLGLNRHPMENQNPNFLTPLPDPVVSSQPKATEEKKHLSAFWLGVWIAIGIIIFGFVSLFSYYLWVERYGSDDQRQAITEQFSEGLTFLPGQSGANSISVDPQTLATITRTHNPRIGGESPSAQILVFIDFECPFCRQAYPTFQSVQDRFGPAVEIIFKHFPIDQFHPNASAAAQAAQCAHNQGKFWEYYEQLFEGQHLTNSDLMQYAAALRLDTGLFATCLADQDIRRQIEQDLTDGIDAGVRGTPTYIIDGKKVEGTISAERWEALILEAIQN